MNNFINAQINAVIVTSITVKKSFLRELKTLSLLSEYFKNFM